MNELDGAGNVNPQTIMLQWYESVLNLVLDKSKPVTPETTKRAHQLQSFLEQWAVEADQAGLRPEQMFAPTTGLFWRISEADETILGFDRSGIVVTRGLEGMKAWGISAKDEPYIVGPRTGRAAIGRILDKMPQGRMA